MQSMDEIRNAVVEQLKNGYWVVFTNKNNRLRYIITNGITSQKLGAHLAKLLVLNNALVEIGGKHFLRGQYAHSKSRG